MENIRIGKHDASDEEVLAAAAAARCDEFVETRSAGIRNDTDPAGLRVFC